MTIYIVGGCPGTGKTTLCRQLARDDARGVHLETDRFFDFVANKLDPSKPEAKQQNAAVLSAWCAAARSYATHDYNVYVDGVIGPWWLEQIDSELEQYEYLVLYAELDACLKRVATRQGQASATSDVVRRMHMQFASALTEEMTYLNVSELEPDVVLVRAKEVFSALA